MASLCVSNLAQFFESLGLTTPYPPTPQPQSACDLTHIPYSSWRPPTCTQKCPGPCAHGAGMRVDERVTMPSPSQRARDADVVADAQAQCAVASAKNPTSQDTEARGQGKLETHDGLDRQTPKSLGNASGEITPDLTSLFAHDDDRQHEVHAVAHAVAAADVDADAHTDTDTHTNTHTLAAPSAQHIASPTAHHKHGHKHTTSTTTSTTVAAPALQPASP